MKLKVAMVTDFPAVPGTIKGGVEGVAYNLVKALASFEVEVFVLSPSKRAQSDSETEDWEGVKVIRVPTSKWVPGFLDYWSLYRRRVKSYLDKIEPDVVHFQGVAGLSIGCRFPSLLTVHGIAERDVLYTSGPFKYLRHKVVSLIERRGRSLAKDIIIINPYVEQILNKQLKGNLWRIPNPTSPEFFYNKSQKQQGRLLFLGRVQEIKNIDGLIKAFDRFVKTRGQGYEQLHIVGPHGESEYLERCKKLVRERGLDDKVLFKGGANRQSVLEELSKASCLVLLSHQEVSPMVIQEAMASHLPVIASDICGNPYLVSQGETGLLVNNRDEEEISQAFARVLDISTNATMSERSSMLAKQEFNSMVVAGKTMEVYRALSAQTKTF